MDSFDVSGHEQEDLLRLQDRLGLTEGIPYTPRWSASPDFLRLIVDHCLEHKPRRVLECSCGTTTLLLARCCRLNGAGEVISLENGAEYADAARASISRNGLERYSHVIHTPLEGNVLAGVNYQWYSLDELPESPVDMLVIDGPPGFLQKHSRYPAIPLLHARLADGCAVFLDDAAREDEREIVARWLGEFPGLSHEYLELERGCSVLRVSR